MANTFFDKGGNMTQVLGIATGFVSLMLGRVFIDHVLVGRLGIDEERLRIAGGILMFAALAVTFSYSFVQWELPIYFHAIMSLFVPGVALVTLCRWNEHFS